jgi:hypothetical protein
MPLGVMAAFGSVVEHLGALRGLPAQTMKLNRRLCGFHLNELQSGFQAGGVESPAGALLIKGGDETTGTGTEGRRFLTRLTVAW